MNDFFSFRNVKLIKSDKISNGVAKYIEDGTYEQHEIDFLLAHVEEDDVILELGSSFGALSTVILCHKQVKNFFCVEANPHIIDLLKENHKLNNVQVDEIINAVMTHDTLHKEFDFYIHPDVWVSSLFPFKGWTSVEKVAGIALMMFCSALNQHL